MSNKKDGSIRIFLGKTLPLSDIEKLATLFKEGTGIIIGATHYRVLSANISQPNGKFVCEVNLTWSEVEE